MYPTPAPPPRLEWESPVRPRAAAAASAPGCAQQFRCVVQTRGCLGQLSSRFCAGQMRAQRSHSNSKGNYLPAISTPRPVPTVSKAVLSNSRSRPAGRRGNRGRGGLGGPSHTQEMNPFPTLRCDTVGSQSKSGHAETQASPPSPQFPLSVEAEGRKRRVAAGQTVLH